MHSKLATSRTDPNDVFVTEPDVVLAAHADNASAMPAHDDMKDRLAALADIASGVSAGTASPSVDTKFRATNVNDIPVSADRASTGKFAKAVFMSLFAICGAAAAAWPHYEDAAKQMIAGLLPPFLQASSQMPAAAGQPDAPATALAAQGSATEQAAEQPSSPDQAPPAAQAAAPDAAAAPGDSSKTPSMARDLANMGQQIEQLKASIEQLRSGQEQMSREIARNSEVRTSETRTAVPNPRARIPAPPRTAAAPQRKPRPTYASSSSPGYRPSPAFLATSPVYPAAPAATVSPAAAAPMPPPYRPQAQIAAEPDGEPVVRPPMPVR